MCWGAQFDCFSGISRWCWARILSTYSSLPEYFGWSDVSSKVSLINDLVSFRNSLLLSPHLPCLAIDWNSDGKMWIWAMFSAGLWQMHFQELYFPMRLAFTLISKKLRKLHNQDYHFSITFIWWYWITFAKIKRPHLNLEGKEPQWLRRHAGRVTVREVLPWCRTFHSWYQPGVISYLSYFLPCSILPCSYNKFPFTHKLV